MTGSGNECHWCQRWEHHGQPTLLPALVFMVGNVWLTHCSGNDIYPTITPKWKCHSHSQSKLNRSYERALPLTTTCMLSSGHTSNISNSCKIMASERFHSTCPKFQLQIPTQAEEHSYIKDDDSHVQRNKCPVSSSNTFSNFINPARKCYYYYWLNFIQNCFINF